MGDGLSGACVGAGPVDAGVDAVPDAPDAAPSVCRLRIAFSDGAANAREIWLANPDGTDLVNLSNNGADDALPSWAPNGLQLAFQSKRNGRWDILTINVNGTGLANLTQGFAPNTGDNTAPVWSADGSKIAFIHNLDYWVMNADGSNRQLAFVGGGAAQYVAWAPSMTQLAANYGQVRVGTIGGTYANATTGFSTVGRPHWAPGSKILFNAFTSDNEVYTINADGSGLVNLSNNPGSEDSSPVASSDSTIVVFSSFRGGHRELWRVPYAGGAATQLTTNTMTESYTGDFASDVSPDGTLAVFARQTDSDHAQLGVVGTDASGVHFFNAPAGSNARGATFSACQ